MSNNGSFVEVFERMCASHNDKQLYSYLDGKGNMEKSYTYGEFDNVTKHLAAQMLGEWGLNVGDIVLLVYPPGLDFIAAFVACFRAGLVAVPVYPPHPNRKKDMNMFVSVQSSCGANVVLTNSEYSYAKRIAALSSVFNKTSPSKQWPEMRWLITNKVKSKGELSGKAAKLLVAANPKLSDLAFLQYTSGSTAAPKGVMLTHKNLACNLTAIINALEATDDTVVVSWLPQYHDMGLIGSYLGVAYCGGSGYYMSPFSFIKSPPLWIESVSKYGATHVQAPNFAYKLTVRKWNEMLSKDNKNAKKGISATLDLSKLRHIFNAAEPVDVNAIDLFNDTFGEYGLRPEAMSPGYGLAENTVYVCDSGKGRLSVDKDILEGENRVVLVDVNAENKNVSLLAGCGNPHRQPENGIHVCIVDQDTLESVKEDIVGEIWVASTSKSDGYYGLKEKSQEELHAKLKTEDESLSKLEWLRTGDLGFMHDGELYICGRIKDLVIIRGRNHFPQDLEFTVENSDYDKLRPGCSASFTIAHPVSGEEVLVVVAEVRNKDMDYNEVIINIRKAIFSDHGLVPFSIVLVEQGTINKTTSGKIKRHGVALSFKNKDLREKYRWESGRLTSDVAVAKSEGDGEVFTNDKKESNPSNGENVKEINGENPSGQALLDELKEEVARLVLVDTDQVKDNVPLIELGMDSLSIAQMKNVIETNYNTEIDETILFAENTSLRVIQKVIEEGPEAAAGIIEAARSGQPKSIREAAKPKKKKKGFFSICGC
mmetsp:Transcript_17948/g.22022  ORF Transcript_17948/g.22022 Transcript_17948/m.22022 type:complete len:767 (-) Transcript_17948:1146-3446(-)